MNSSRAIGTFVARFTLAFWTAVMAVVPQILTNLISDILANWFNIETSDGTRLVIVLAFVTLLMYAVLHGLRGMTRELPFGSAGLGSAKMQFLLQGSLFSLAILMTLACEGLFDGPFSLDQLLGYLAALIPTLEGAVGQRIIVREAERLHLEIMGYIDRLLRKNPRATQSMVEGYIRQFMSAALMPPEALSHLVRTRMATYYEQKRREGRNDVTLDSYRDPNNWKLLREHAA